MGIKTVPQPPYSPDLAPCDFWLFPKLRGCRYETSEEMKVIDTLIQEDFHGTFQKLLERYKCIAAGGDYFEGDKSFMCVPPIKRPYKKSLETYLMILVLRRPQKPNGENKATEVLTLETSCIFVFLLPHPMISHRHSSQQWLRYKNFELICVYK